MSPISIPGKVTLQKEFVPQDFMYKNPDTFGLWTPAAITTELWADASDSSTVTLTSGKVSQWDDKSGNSRHLVQTNSSYQPDYSSASFNDFNAIDYPGTAKWFEVSSFGSGTYSWFFAFKVTSNFSTFTFLGDTGSTTTTYVPISAQGSSNTSILRVEGVADPAGAYQIYGGESSQSVSTRDDVNDQLKLTGNIQGNICGYINIPVITDTIKLGYMQTGYFITGELGEVICVSGTPSASNIEKIQGYLAHKWGHYDKLPSDHPYKNGGPTL